MKNQIKKFITYLYNRYCKVEEYDPLILDNNLFKYSTLFYNNIAIDIFKMIEIFNFELSLTNPKNKIFVEINSENLITIKFPNEGSNRIDGQPLASHFGYSIWEVARIVDKEIFISKDVKRYFHNLKENEMESFNYDGMNLTKVIEKIFRSEQIKNLFKTRNIFTGRI